MSKIQWTAVPEFPGYEVSDTGDIRSFRRGAVRILSPRLGRHGYLAVCLRRNGVTFQRLVHRIVAEAFLGPADGRWVNHKDGVKTTNVVANLEWVTPGENALHAYRTNLQPSRVGAGNGKAKLTDEAVREIRRQRAMGTPVKVLAAEFGVSKSRISEIANRKGWCHA